MELYLILKIISLIGVLMALYAILKNLDIIRPYQDINSYSALHLYPIQIKADKVKNTRKEIFEALRKNDVGVNVHYIPVHTHPYYEEMGFKKGDFLNAESFYENVISIPMFQGLTIEMQDKVVEILKKFLV